MGSVWSSRQPYEVGDVYHDDYSARAGHDSIGECKATVRGTLPVAGIMAVFTAFLSTTTDNCAGFFIFEQLIVGSCCYYLFDHCARDIRNRNHLSLADV